MKFTPLFGQKPIKAVVSILLISAVVATAAIAQNAAPAAAPVAHAPLPPAPAPMGIPHPAPATDQPYAPQPIVAGGIVMTLYPPDSKYLNAARIKEPEVYNMDQNVPGRIGSIVNIHNPSIEVHMVAPALNTGTAIIVAAGGGHTTLNVGGESADFIPFFYNYGINTIILRNRIRPYNSKTDEVYDAQQAIRLVRAHAAEWHIDPKKIGIMGFSAGAELSAPAAVLFPDWDKNNSDPSDPLAGITSRPDFVGIIYPGPSPFQNPANAPVIPRNVPPAFIACAGSGDQQHAVWATQYFDAMLAISVPNIEMHIYANGHHPGSGSTGGLTDRIGTPYGTWQYRFIDWMRDLGFLQKSGVETRAAQESAAFAAQTPRGGRGGGGAGGGRGGRGGRGAAGAAAPAAPGAAAPAAPGAPANQ